MANSSSGKIGNPLWVLVAFIPFINGLGFTYIGAKRLNYNWLKEGLIYEIPWFLQFLFINNDSLATFFAGLGMAFMLICLIRSIYVYYNNKESLAYIEGVDGNSYKSSSPYWVIFSFIIFLNGLGLILVGLRRNVQRWIWEGAIFELLWVLYFMLFSASKTVANFLISIAMIGWILSIVITFMIYFEEKRMDSNSHYSPKPTIDASNSRVDTSPVKIVDEEPGSDIIPQFKQYFRDIKELNSTFDHKEESLRTLIDKRFNKEELTYDRFTSVINNCHKLFYHQSESALSIIDLAPEYSVRLDESIKGKISIMNGIIEEMNTLIEEFIIHDGSDEQSNEELNELFANMDNLISSVKDYK